MESGRRVNDFGTGDTGMIGIAILEVVFPVFILAGVGFLWVRQGWGFDIAFVTRLAMDFAMPCLVFGTMAGTRFEPEVFRALAGATVALYVLLAAVFAAVVWRMGMKQRDMLLPLVSANTGNMGLPLCLFAFGEQGLVYGIVIFAAMIMLQFTFGLWLVSGEASPMRALRQPLLHAAVFGALLSWAEIDLPSWIDNALTLAGQPAIPLMLLALGASMATLPAAFPTRAVGLSAFKLLLSAGLAFAVARAAGLSEAATDVFVLQAVTPVAVTTYMLAERYGRSPAEVAQLVMVSTAMVALALPGILWLIL